jgi:hypothetical protein
MEWYNYIAVFFSGAFLANAIPHLVYGICGDKFPTPFAKPPGQGLTSSTGNVLWAGFNIIVGYILFRRGPVQLDDTLNALVFFLGFMALALLGATNFPKKHKE